MLDTQSLQEVKRLEASRNPWSLALSPDGKHLLVTNTLPRFVPFRTPPDGGSDDDRRGVGHGRTTLSSCPEQIC